eukprot:4558513-Ditylum_brightwellii.AAC.1
MSIDNTRESNHSLGSGSSRGTNSSAESEKSTDGPLLYGNESKKSSVLLLTARHLQEKDYTHNFSKKIVSSKGTKNGGMTESATMSESDHKDIFPSD